MAVTIRGTRSSEFRMFLDIFKNREIFGNTFNIKKFCILSFNEEDINLPRKLFANIYNTFYAHNIEYLYLLSLTINCSSCMSVI